MESNEPVTSAPSMKVLFNALRTLPGGVSVYRDELVRGLQADPGIELLVACRAEFAEEWGRAGIRLESVAMPRPPFDKAWERRHLRRISRSFQPDLIHTPATFFVGRESWGCRLVATVHDLSYRSLPSGRAFRLYRRLSLGSCVQLADALIAISAHTYASLGAAFPRSASKTAVIANGYRGPRTLPALEPRVVGEQPFLLTFGHWPHKNCEGAVRALAELLPRIPDLELRVVGTHPEAERAARSEARALGVSEQVRFLGRVTDEELWELYSGALGLLFLSYFEGSGLPALEAMAIGCPLVVSDRGALPETSAGHCDVVSPEDAVGAARAVEGHLDDPQASVRQRLAAREHVAAFTWSRTVEETVALYRRVLAGEDLPPVPVEPWLDAAWDLPEEVERMLAELAEACADEEVLCTLLTGSTARGELAIERGPDGIRLRSDVEFYVIAPSPTRARARLAPRIEEVERRYAATWDGFHVDVAYLTPDHICALEPWLRHFELQANARVLSGMDLRPCLPRVDLDNLDWQELNEVALWRLLSLVIQLPSSWLAGEESLDPELAHRLCRNMLDLTTWALPGVGRLLPSFRERVAVWPDEGQVPGLEGLELPDAALLRACLAARSDSSALPLDQDLLGAAVDAWDSVLATVFGRLDSSHRGRGLGMRRLDPARRARGAYRVRSLGLRAIRSVGREGPFEPAARCALELAHAARAWRTGEEPWGILERSRSLLGVDPPPSPPPPGSFRAHWLELRERLALFMDLSLSSPQWQRFLPEQDARRGS